MPPPRDIVPSRDLRLRFGNRQVDGFDCAEGEAGWVSKRFWWSFSILFLVEEEDNVGNDAQSEKFPQKSK